MTVCLVELGIFRVGVAFKIKSLVGVYSTAVINGMAFIWLVVMRKYGLSLVGIIK